MKTAGTNTLPMTNYQKAHHLLHVLWTKAVGTKDYDKKQWQELETAIYRLIKPDFDDADTPPIGSLHTQRTESFPTQKEAAMFAKMKRYLTMRGIK